MLSAAAAFGHVPFSSAADESLYDVPSFGAVRIIHTCDTHAQLLPVYFREPDTNFGVGKAAGKPPHLVGDALLTYYGIAKDSAWAYALSYVNMDDLAKRYGAVGGFAGLATLIGRLRADYGAGKTLHLDSGDMWHGSATALRNGGSDMVRAANLLGVNAMVGHWEFTYPEQVIRENVRRFNGDFLGHNLSVKEEALFDGAEAYDEDNGWVFPPYSAYDTGGYRIVVIGQAFPFTPISNPQRFIPDWTFGIRRESLQRLVDDVRGREKPDAVILLSHNGTDLDLAMAEDINGIDFILGGHTHDILYQPRVVNQTVVINSGCVGKFASCLDIDFGASGVRDYRFRALPVFANLLPADVAMAALIEKERAADVAELSEELATTDGWLYRRGNFNGTMDELILDALRAHYGSDIALSPGFRWGTSVPAGGTIRMEDVMNATAMTYPETYSRQMRGADIKQILEGVADNLYHPDPYYRHGGDMVRIGGLRYTLAPAGESRRRVSDLRLLDDSPLQADKLYTVAGWATQTPSDGPPVWNIVADYLRQKKHIAPLSPTVPDLRPGG